jgi:hypothetical protein
VLCCFTTPKVNTLYGGSVTVESIPDQISVVASCPFREISGMKSFMGAKGCFILRFNEVNRVAGGLFVCCISWYKPYISENRTWLVKGTISDVGENY